MSRRHLAVNTGARRRAIVLGAIPLALAVGCSTGTHEPAAQSGPTNSAASSPSAPAQQQSGPRQQPDTATPPPASGGQDAAPIPFPTTSQPGVVATPESSELPQHRGPVQPGVTAPPVPAPPAAPAPDYVLPQDFRAIPDTDTAPAIDLGNLHAPAAVTPVAPIAPPPRTLRLGAYTTPVPDDVPNPVLDTVNTGAADTEAAIATGLNSVGINASRSDKIAGLTIAGAAGGAALGAAAAGIPAAVVGAVPGAVIGATVGGIAGGIIGGVVGTPLPGVGNVAGSTAGAAIGIGVGAAAGGAVGAAALGIPAAVVGGIAGGVIGGAAGTAFGAAV